ncbi:hypothetical protein HAX54_041729 [Datura stramonium]|uniref:Uncharacterized protein n=1 Tax=Datura stramonium TaxID=4076 RepID=A0ABS8VY92_DATST|nr:hypothetical protein [Datura stramonium]
MSSVPLSLSLQSDSHMIALLDPSSVRRPPSHQNFGDFLDVWEALGFRSHHLAKKMVKKSGIYRKGECEGIGGTKGGFNGRVWEVVVVVEGYGNGKVVQKMGGVWNVGRSLKGMGRP